MKTTLSLANEIFVSQPYRSSGVVCGYINAVDVVLCAHDAEPLADPVGPQAAAVNEIAAGQFVFSAVRSPKGYMILTVDVFRIRHFVFVRNEVVFA